MNEADDDGPLPPLRADLEPVAVEHEGKPLFLLQDAEGLSDSPLALSPAGLLIASLLDGKRTPAEIGSLFAQQTGNLLGAAEVKALAAQLERAGMLESAQIQAKRRRIFEDFLASPLRRAMFKDGAYPGQPLELVRQLGDYLRDPKGPGKTLSEAPSGRAAGLVSPHIDFQRGGPAYAWAYQALSEMEPPDAVVGVGVAHASPNSPWVMTHKAYETPHGPLAVDEALYGEIAAKLWYDPLADEWVHRREHSLEFQAVWLKFLWKDKTPPWVPILCSSFERFCEDRAPSAVDTIETALRSIGEVLSRRAKRQRVLILAGVDLAHVGPRFGDDLELGPETEQKVEETDRRSLDAALALDADAFYLSGIKEGAWRKVCGLSALYTSLRWIKTVGGGAGRLLAYGQAPDPAGGLVSFASAIYPG